MLSTFAQYQFYARDMSASLQRVAATPIVSQATKYFQANIGKVTSVDGFLNNFRLFSYAMEAYGLKDQVNAKALMKKVLESDLTDPNSFANKLTDVRYKNFAAAFNFNTTGAVASSADIQSDDQSQDTLGLYADRSTSDASTAATATTYYTTNIANVTSVDDLLSDPKLYSYVIAAYGIDPSSADESAADVKNDVKQVLESDKTSSNSFAAKSGDPRYAALAAAFNFSTDGTLATGTTAQTAAQQTSLKQAYAANYNNAAARPDELANAYYQANIGHVGSVNDLMSNNALYTYALTAYGINPSTVSQATIKSVLESDPNDPTSFANGNIDHRFRDLAAAFNFTSSGTVATGQSAQSSNQILNTVSFHAQQSSETVASSQAATSYYQANIGTVTSVDAFVNNGNLYDYALMAVGLDPDAVSKTTIKQVLESDPTDPKSFAAQLHDSRYLALASAFNFNAAGNVPTGQSTQSAAQTQSITTAYQNSASDAQANTAYYQANIGNVTSVDQLLADPKLYTYLLTTYGIDASSRNQSTTDVKATIKQVLESNLFDPNSVARQQSYPGFLALAQAFNFNSSGTLAAGQTAQSASQQQGTTAAYAKFVNANAAASDLAGTQYFTANIGQVKTLNDLMNNTALYDYALSAFGLDPATESQSKIRAVLTSDASGRNTYANSLGDQRYADLAAAFNFAADGTVTSAPVAQTTKDMTATVTAYVGQLSSSAADKATAKTEAAYYESNIVNVTSVDQLLSDTRLTAFVVKAYGLSSAAPSNAVLRKVLDSDLSDPNSYANTQSNPAYRNLAVAFNFTSDGTVGRKAPQQVQSRLGALTTGDSYLRQTMEDQAGASNTGVQLALYFQRKATSIKTPYDILADKALLKVVQTALNLPASFSNAGIDIQARAISQKINFSDFQDPTKLQKFIGRFTALYDLQNPTQSGTSATSLSAASTILGGSTSSSSGNGILALFGG